MPKSFKNVLSKNQEEKKSTNLESENQRLREKITAHNQKIQELQNEINHAENSNSFKLLDIKHISEARNIRDLYIYENIEELAENILKVGQLQPLVLTSDHKIIIGHRRYKAIELLKEQGKHDGKAKIITIDKKFSEMDLEIFDKIQMSENEQRKALDNFQMSKLFNDYVEKGYKQNQIAEIFDKTKNFVSAVLTVKDIPDNLQKYLQEIQYYGMSKKKLHACNLSVTDRKPVIVGINTLCKISRADDVEKVKAFIKLFGSKLSEEELNEFGYTEKKHVSKVDKFSDTLNSQFKSLKKSYKDKKSLKIIEEAEKIIDELNKKLMTLN